MEVQLAFVLQGNASLCQVAAGMRGAARACRSLLTAGKAASAGALFEEGWEVLHIDDRMHAVDACAAGARSPGTFLWKTR